MRAANQVGNDRQQSLPGQIDLASVHSQLERILASPQFKHSRRCQALLRFVVESACHGRIEDLKERVVGSSVFGREADYDTNQDAVVRNAAAEVRKRLAQYYMESTAEDAIRIELPTGSYVPEFNFHSPPSPVGSRKRGGWRLAAGMAAGFALAALSGLAIWGIHHWRGSNLDKFWEPLVSSPGVVQVCVGQSGMYYYPGPAPVNGRGEPDSGGKIPVSSLLPMRDRFLYFGDSVCLARVNGYLQTRKKDFRFRGARTTPYSELRGLPLVLIGAFNNEWNVRLTQDLRFSLSSAPAAFSVIDKQSRNGAAFQVSRSGTTDWDVETDYALVTRMFDPSTENWVIAAGGFTSFGTMMAGDFISKPEYFEAALASAHPGWEKRNMQVVLQTKVVGGTPGPPKVMATHFW